MDLDLPTMEEIYQAAYLVKHDWAYCKWEGGWSKPGHIQMLDRPCECCYTNLDSYNYEDKWECKYYDVEGAFYEQQASLGEELQQAGLLLKQGWVHVPNAGWNKPGHHKKLEKACDCCFQKEKPTDGKSYYCFYFALAEAIAES